MSRTITFTQLSAFPDALFFASLNRTATTDFLGNYSAKSIELTLRPTSTTGNAWVYQGITPPPREPFKADVFGEVVDVDIRQTEVTTEEETYTLKIRAPTDASSTMKALFASSARFLDTVIAREARPNTGSYQKWVEFEGEVCDEAAYIYVECGKQTECLANPYTIGARVLFNITLHRRDLRCDGVIIKHYTLAAYRAESVSCEFLRDVGLSEVGRDIYALEKKIQELEIGV